jgi:hypothetical protein
MDTPLRRNSGIETRSNIALFKQFSAVLADLLWPLGYRKRTSGVMTATLSKECLAWLGLNRAVLSDPLLVNPFVGIRNQPVERLVAELSGRPYHPFSPPTLVIDLGSAVGDPSKGTFFIATDADIPVVASQIRSLVESYALPFARANLDLNALVDALADPRFSEPLRSRMPRNLPVALLLLGCTREGLEVVDASVSALRSARYPAATEYRRFAAAYRRRARAQLTT